MRLLLLIAFGLIALFVLGTSSSASMPGDVPRCPDEQFTDVCPGDYFYTPVISLTQLSVIAGYNSSPPCETSDDVPCYLPANNLTRGQISKITVLAAGLPINTEGGPHFYDVLPGSTFYEYVETLYNFGSITGYPNGNFEPNRKVTRGNAAKIIVLGFVLGGDPTGQTFEDVPTGHYNYVYIERIASRGIINGYPCGTAQFEPCNPPENRPYFRQGNDLTRAQAAKIIYLSRQATPIAK